MHPSRVAPPAANADSSLGRGTHPGRHTPPRVESFGRGPNDEEQELGTRNWGYLLFPLVPSS